MSSMTGIRDAKTHRVVSFSPRAENLEDRTLLATAGLPWGDARQLSLSFAPDGTAIAGHTSTLFQTLDAHQATAAWKRQILTAFQTWTSNANINIGLKLDGGQAFGSAGLTQHDTRFGDIRVAAQPMSPDALAISVPSGSLMTGTLAGDVFLNSDTFASTSAPSLFGVTLHEAGHVFGLDDSTDPKSAMYYRLSGATALNSDDIASLQALYGSRAPDSFEGSSGNGSISKAASIPIPGNHYQGERPIALFADLTSALDVDIYKISPQANYTGAMTVRLQSAGISLLAPHLTITDANGRVLGEAQANSGFGDTVTVHLARVTPGQNYYLRVDSKAGNAFAIGEYGLAVSFDGTNRTSPALLDAALEGDYGLLASRDLDAIFQGNTQPFFNDDLHTNDVPLTAAGLLTTPGYARGTHYEVVGSLSDAADVDFYQVSAAEQHGGGSQSQPTVMTVTVRALALNGISPKATILDANQQPIPVSILANGNGMYTIQAIGITPGANYFLKISGFPTWAGTTGNYGLTVDFGTKTADVSSFVSGSTTSQTTTRSYDLYVARSQMFDLLLAAGNAPAGTKVKLTIKSSSGSVLFTLLANAGDTVSGNTLFLTPGAYVITFETIGVTGTPVPAISYQLMGYSITDPVGPSTVDPTLSPIYPGGGGTGTQPPIYTYPGNVKTTKPFYIAIR